MWQPLFGAPSFSLSQLLPFVLQVLPNQDPLPLSLRLPELVSLAIPAAPRSPPLLHQTRLAPAWRVPLVRPGEPVSKDLRIEGGRKE